MRLFLLTLALLSVPVAAVADPPQPAPAVKPADKKLPDKLSHEALLELTVLQQQDELDQIGVQLRAALDKASQCEKPKLDEQRKARSEEILRSFSVEPQAIANHSVRVMADGTIVRGPLPTPAAKVDPVAVRGKPKK